jgi:benzoyl-CoA reductase/2-hydroxyglutaryl-CoA dehydratase subunit BcrC/BadD/HgdB
LELLHALDLDPVLLTFGGSPSRMHEGEEYVRADACPLCRSRIGEGAAGAHRLGDLPLLVGLARCDQERRMFETLDRLLGLPVLCSVAPRTRSENAFDRYVEEVQHLVLELEFRFGTRFRQEALPAAIARVSRLRRRLRRWRGRLGFPDFATLAHGSLALGAEEAFELLDELEPPEPPAPSVRLLLAGSCVARDDLVFARDLERLGAEIVEDATAYLGVVLDLEVPPSAASVRDVAWSYFHQPDVAARPNDAYYDALRRKVESTAPDGVLYRALKFCDVCAGEQVRVREAVAPVPVLVLDDEYDASARPRRLTRLEAFMEMIRCRTA